ncbi:MAG: hydroxymethylbilane synthase [Parasphingorhabdus sp.]
MTKKTHEDKIIRSGIDRPMKIGTRQSPLAMVQAELAAKSIIAAHGWRSDQVELVPMIATGDKIQDKALADVGGKALWTKELDRALAEGDIDCAVHSMKDVETIRPDIFTIGAMLERAATHDKLVGAKSINDLPKNAVVGTASPRRKAQLLNLRSDLDIRLIRGNVQTRLKKIENGEFDATLLAAAGLDRLGMTDIGSTISKRTMLPAPSQGAVGIEVRSEDRHMRQILRKISHTETFREVTAERVFLKELKADCHSPVAALAKFAGKHASMRAEILLPCGTERIADRMEFDSGDVAAPKRLAQKLLVQASDELKSAFGT